MDYNSAFFSNTRPSVGGLVFDATMRENHDYEALITQHPVEAGANIVDNVVIDPVVVTLDIFVGSIYAINPLLLGNSINRPGDALAKLRQLMVNREPLTVVCRLASYQNMLIKSVIANQDIDSSSSLLATVTLQEAITVNDTGSTGTNPADKQYSPPTNGGSRQAPPA